MAKDNNTAYRDWLRSQLGQWPEYGDLSNFFDSGIGITSTSTLTFFDFVGPSFVKTSSVFRDTDVDWVSYASQDIPGSRLRVILLAHSQDNISRDFLDKVGQIYDVDPLDYARHLVAGGCLRGEIADLTCQPSESAVKVGSMAFDHATFIFASPSAAVAQAGRTNTVIILLERGRDPDDSYGTTRLPSRRLSFAASSIPPTATQQSQASLRSIQPPPLSPKTNAETLTHVLTHISADQIEHLLNHPHSTIIVFLEMFLRQWQTITNREIEDIRRNCPICSVNETFAADMCMMFQRGPMNVLDHLLTAKRNLESPSLMKKISPEHRDVLRRHIRHLEQMMTDLQAAFDWQEKRGQSCVNRRSVRSAEASMKVAADSSVLTILVFFFAPLSLATSCFGMNLDVLGSGSVAVWWPIVVSVAMLVFSAGCWYLAGKITSLYRSTADLRLSLFAVVSHCAMLLRDPKGFWWLLVYASTHAYKDTVWLLWVVGVSQSISNHVGDSHRIEDEESREHLISTFLHHPWQERARMIHGKLLQRTKTYRGAPAEP